MRRYRRRWFKSIVYVLGMVFAATLTCGIALADTSGTLTITSDTSLTENHRRTTRDRSSSVPTA
jgi:hypothetical protein